ncbi:3-oxoacyl-[acyl-carrier-protein] synthase 2 [bacterium BMS3Bbin06]|nr:3-oxoacyl-[acyl-carrier-protein] synthase 2 [bacterium BMS3Bbin06]HDO34922.1 beta-ketoacyl-[acyl-carrier-protein] synthase family protein [Nitrospirota bacterium]HDY70110.1 beta-ketoacyl-[acyl-carrier-protein] synthase family protein [Nitrospirota bacterium]
MKIPGCRRVVVTGLGLVTALGLSVEETWRRALAGECGIRRLSCEGSDGSQVQAVGDVRDEDWRRIKEGLVHHSGEGERRTLFALWAAREAMSDAGLKDRVDSRRAGVVFSAGLGINRLEDIRKWLKEDGSFDIRRFGKEYDRVSADSIIRNNSQRPASLIADLYGLRGINCTITTACASATQAIGTAYMAIRRGDADIAVTGGADSMVNPVGLVFFVLLGAAATGREEPERTCRPFDRRRAGLVMGEGAGVVVLEEEGHARSRGARIYAEVSGYGSSMDAYQVTAPHPKGTGAVVSMRNALIDAEMKGDEIDYINAHGTGTKLNDVAETLAIKSVFKEHAFRLVINSSKSLIGHLLSASGGPEFVFTTLSVYNNQVHPTVNLTQPDPRCDLDYLSGGMREMEVSGALSNSFGFGGQNASIVVRKYD